MDEPHPALMTDIRFAKTIVKPGGYLFRKYGFGEESELFKNDVINEICGWCRELTGVAESEILVGIEPGGLPWALLFGFIHGKSVLPIRSSHSKLDNLSYAGESVRNLYSQKMLFLEMAGAGQKVYLIDDVISSGDTLLKAADLIAQNGFDLVGIAAILARDKERVVALEAQMKLKICVLHMEPS